MSNVAIEASCKPVIVSEKTKLRNVMVSLLQSKDADAVMQNVQIRERIEKFGFTRQDVAIAGEEAKLILDQRAANVQRVLEGMCDGGN